MQTADPLSRATALIHEFTLEEKLNNTGHVSPGVPRLGLPAYMWWQEALHGVADSPGVNFSDSGPFSIATSFPQPILMGAAFDDQLIVDVATVISIEARAFNNDDRAGLDFWTPNIVRRYCHTYLWHLLSANMALESVQGSEMGQRSR